MKRILPVFLLLIISLSGCGVKDSVQLECIADTLSEENAPAFYIESDIPSEAVLTASCNDGCCAVFSHEDYEIYQEIFAAENIDSAFVSLTGQNTAQLAPICISSFPYEEYRFAWTAAGEGGTLSCTGKVFYDGEFCYALMIRCPVEEGNEYQEVFCDLISTATIEAV